MSMKALEDLREMFCQELEEIARKPEMSAGDLDAVHKLTDTIKNIDKIEMMDEDGYSQDGRWEAEMRGDYGRGSSYARRGEHYVRGHYSRDGGGSGRGGQSYSRNRYSRSSGDLISHMERMMDEAETEKERDAIRRCMESLRYD